MLETLKWIIKKSRLSSLRLVLLTVFQSIISLSGVVYALLFRYLIDSATSGSYDRVKQYTLYFLFIIIVQGMINAVLRRTQEVTIVEIEKNLKRDILHSIFEREYVYVSGVHSGEWMNKITNDTSVISQNLAHLLPNLVCIALQIAVTICVLFSFVPGFMWGLFVMIAIAMLFEFCIFSRIKILHKDLQLKDGLLRAFLQECINSLVVIKTYSQAKNMLDEFNNNIERYERARLKRNAFSILLNFIFGTGMNGLLMLSSVYCAYMVMNKNMSYGTLVAVIEIVSQIRSPLTRIYGNIPNYYSLLGSAERLKEIENYAIEKEPANMDFISFYQNDLKAIRILDLSFSYTDKNDREQVFDNLSININKGEFIAIAGPSGCGKSTLFKLLLSLYKPEEGKIEIVTDDSEIPLDSSHRALFAYVPQNNQLMKGSIKEAICFNKQFDANKMETALQISCCNEFISKLPNGIDSMLKEKGNGLSEGQIQRIAIARAIYSDRPVLLLDEVTSSLNEELELSILQKIKSLTDKTVLMISHHKSALSFADKTIYCYEEEGKYLWNTKKQ